MEIVLAALVAAAVAVSVALVRAAPARRAGGQRRAPVAAPELA